MKRNSRLIAATICSWTSAVAFALALGALLLYFTAALDTRVLLIAMAATSAVAIITGIASAWFSRLAKPIATLTTIGFAIAGGFLGTGALANLFDYISGGSNNIGATLLLMVGAVVAIPATAGAVMLAVMHPRKRPRVDAPQA